MKVRIYILTIILLTVSVEKVFATGQIPDILIYNNDTLLMFANPLEELTKVDSLKVKLFEDNKEHWNTSCWRGYQAEWTIINNQLFLTAIYSCNYYEDSIKSDLKQLFGEKFINGKVKADWVTGEILSGYGNIFFCFYESFYEKEIDFKFLNGQLKDLTTYNNSKSRKSNYSDETTLLKFIYSNIQWDKLPKKEKSAIVYVQFSGNEDGIIDSVKIMKGLDIIFDNEAVRVVKSIPEWDVFYRRGQHERRDWLLPLVFSEEMKQEYKQN